MIGFTGRTASGMVQDMLNLSTSYRTTSSKPDMDSVSPPSTPGSSQQDNVFSLDDEQEDPLTRSLQLSAPKDSPSHSKPLTSKVHSLSSSLSMWRMPEDVGECRDDFLPLDSGRESDHESDSESTISSVSSVRSSSKGSESSSSNGGGLSSEEGAMSAVRSGQKGGRISPELGGKKTKGEQTGSRSDSGYCTLPHPPRNGAVKGVKKGKMPAAFKRISTIANSKKRKSISADISSPSGAHPTTSLQENASWSGRRQKAIRRTKLSSSFGKSDYLQPIIHETSYSYQIQSVTVVFRDSFKTTVDCRGTDMHEKTSLTLLIVLLCVYVS